MAVIPRKGRIRSALALLACAAVIGGVEAIGGRDRTFCTQPTLSEGVGAELDYCRTRFYSDACGAVRSFGGNRLCALRARTPLQGLEAKLTWRVPETSGFQKLQERMTNFYNLKGKMDFHVVGAPVRKGVLCEKLYRVTEGAYEWVRPLFRPILCETCVEGCEPGCFPYIEKGNPNDSEWNRIQKKRRAAAANVRWNQPSTNATDSNTAEKRDQEQAEQENGKEATPQAAQATEKVKGENVNGDNKNDQNKKGDDFDISLMSDEEYDNLPEYYVCDLNVATQCIHLEGDVPETISASWSTRIDSFRVFCLVFGLACIFFYDSLGRSKVLHSIIGATFGASLVLILCFYWLYRQAKGAVPFSGATFAIFNLSLVLAPSFALYVCHSLAPSWSSVYGLVSWIVQLKEPYYNLPVGLFGLIVSILGGVILGRRIFGSAQFEELQREIRFHIGRDGSRIDEIDEDAEPLPQKCLQFFLFGIGIVAILQSTTVPALNLAILLVSLGWGWIFHLWDNYQRNREASQNPFHKQLEQKKKDGSMLNRSSYEEQAKTNTEIELEKLRKYLATQQGKKAVNRSVTGTDAELRMRRFVDGGSDVDQAMIMEAEEERARHLGGMFGRFW